MILWSDGAPGIAPNWRGVCHVLRWAIPLGVFGWVCLYALVWAAVWLLN